MRVSETTLKSFSWLAATVVSLGLVGFAGHEAKAQDSDETETYDWSAQLVSFDRTSSTAVFKARIESHATIDNLEEFSDGDRLILVWSGRSWAAGVRDLARDPELTPDTLSLPVEFVSSENDNQYLNFRIHVPEASAGTIAAFEPGTRVTGISPKMATNWTTGVQTLRHYNDVS